MRYRRKPGIVDAERWYTDKDMDGIELYVTDKYDPLYCHVCGHQTGEHGLFSALDMTEDNFICPGDWIITDDHGEQSICSHDRFLERYEPVDGEERIDNNWTSSPWVDAKLSLPPTGKPVLIQTSGFQCEAWLCIEQPTNDARDDGTYAWICCDDMFQIEAESGEVRYWKPLEKIELIDDKEVE